MKEIYKYSVNFQVRQKLKFSLISYLKTFCGNSEECFTLESISVNQSTINAEAETRRLLDNFWDKSDKKTISIQIQFHFQII